MIRTAIVLLFSSILAFGQARKEFEVATIKASGSQAPNQLAAGLHVDGSQVRITFLSLKDYVRIAYRTRLNQIIGPDWMGSDRFDISAKLPDGSAQTDVPEMLLNLLVDRFQLKVHRESRDMPVYILGVASGGIKIPESVTAEFFEGRAPLNIAAGGNASGVAIDFGQGSTITLGTTTLESKKLPMSIFADMLTRMLDRPVLDQTNLKGGYDMTVDLTPEDRTVMLIRSAVNAGIVLPPQALALLDLGSPTSLMDGLKKYGVTLEAKRAPLEVLVVDQAQKTPSEN